MSSKGFYFYFKQFDFLSQKPTLLINNSERIRSILGACFTIALAGLIISFTLVLLIKLLSRSDPDFLVTTIRDEGGAKFDIPIFVNLISDLDSDVIQNFTDFLIFDIEVKIYENNIYNITAFEVGYSHFLNMTDIFMQKNLSLYVINDEINISLKFNSSQIQFEKFLKSFTQKIDILFTYQDTNLDFYAIEKPQKFNISMNFFRLPLLLTTKYQMMLNLIKNIYTTD